MEQKQVREVRSHQQAALEDVFFGQSVILWARWSVILAGAVLVLWTSTTVQQLTRTFPFFLVLMAMNFFLHGRYVMGSPLNRSVVVAASIADLLLITAIVVFWPGSVGLKNQFFVLYYPVVFAFALVFPRAIEAAYTALAILAYATACFVLGTVSFANGALDLKVLLMRLIVIAAMGFLGKIAASLRAGLSAALAPAVDPRTTYVNAHEKQQALLAQVGRAMDQVTASKHRLQARAADDRARLPKMLEDARAELVAGRSDSARLVLRRRQVVALELSALELQLAEVENDEANLQVLQRRLANQVDEFVARQQVIVARYNAAEAQIQIKEAVTGVSKEFAELTASLEQAEEKTEGMEGRVSAIDRLVREGLLEQGPLASSAGDLDSRLQLAGAEDEVEGQLAALQHDIARPST